MNLQRVSAARVVRQLAEQRLAAEQRKFEVGVSITLLRVPGPARSGLGPEQRTERDP